MAFISQIEPKNIHEVKNDENWMISMQEELNQFERNEVWELVSSPQNKPYLQQNGFIETWWMKME